MRCWVNGELRQDARTTDLIFDIPTLIETCSRGITLLPGDLLLVSRLAYGLRSALAEKLAAG